MLPILEYHRSVKPLNCLLGAAFGVLYLVCSAAAQINGMPASVTSPGFGGHQVNGVPPSVTSLGPRGYTPAFPTCCFRGVSPSRPNPTFNFRHHHPHGSFVPFAGPVIYAVPAYGYYDSGETTEAPPEEQYNGGPTIFDRRGPGTSAPAATEAQSGPQPEPEPPPAPQTEEPTAAKDQPQTVLVFKDGRQLEVANYAIVGSTLFDLTGGRRHKIALADLDLTATAKQNDERGLDFQLPVVPEAN
jgi:hypothetical protein